MDFELYFKVHNLVSVCPKSIILGEIFCNRMLATCDSYVAIISDIT